MDCRSRANARVQVWTNLRAGKLSLSIKEILSAPGEQVLRRDTRKLVSPASASTEPNGRLPRPLTDALPLSVAVIVIMRIVFEHSEKKIWESLSKCVDANVSLPTSLLPKAVRLAS